MPAAPRKIPTYQEVCTETTGHAEVTQIEFDPAKISYAKLLEVFWQAHDPTTLNRQGADEGTSYRSIILYRDKQQQLLAEKSKLEAQKNFHNPIVTEIVPLKKFYKAEDYHQEYYDKNPNQRLLPGGHRAQAGKAGKEKNHPDRAADGEMNEAQSLRARFLFSTAGLKLFSPVGLFVPRTAS